MDLMTCTVCFATTETKHADEHLAWHVAVARNDPPPAVIVDAPDDSATEPVT